jgi:hypothetical protein
MIIVHIDISYVNFYFFGSYGIAINYHSRFACTLYLWQFHVIIFIFSGHME